MPARRPSTASRPGRIGLGALAAVLGCAAATVVWAADGQGTFWPRWVMFGTAVLLGAGIALELTIPRPPGARRRLAIHTGLTLVLIPTEIASWLLSGQGFFWPAWPIVGFAALLGGHALVVARMPERELSARVEELTRTRTGALDTQAAELRRIERDLHDGAQARLVAAGMSIGLAEQLLRSDPDEAAALMAEARQATVTAVDELRAVMRGIQPPVLSDRGLLGALRALALDLGLELELELAAGATEPVEPPLPVPVRSAVYFALAECLTNVVRHSGTRRARLAIEQRPQTFTATVTDDGCGGATLDAAAGTGLPGIVERLAAFDGDVTVDSPAGGPTAVTLELPCAW